MDRAGPVLHPAVGVMGQPGEQKCGAGPDQRYLSPLRYPGGKARLANFIKLVVRANGLTDGHYLEPYAGGASVALALLIGEYVAHIHINDLDRSVYAFWHSVLNEPEALCRRIMRTTVSVAEWRRQRAVQSDGHASLLDLGFSAFFLNRTNRSGIICSGGMIGGVEQAGQWQLNARFPKTALVARIELIASYRDRISLYQRDTLALLRTLLPRTPQKTLVYLDPPYYVKGRRRLYANSYEHEDHVAIAQCLAKARRPWIVSYDDVKQIRALYRGWPHRRYTLSYAVRERYEGAEVMFFSQDLKAPSLQPVGIRQSTVDRLSA
jgi:DNA adenine methylase